MKQLILLIFSMFIVVSCSEENTKIQRGHSNSIQSSGEIVANRSRSITPPQFENMWNVKISMLSQDGSRVQPGKPVVSFDTQELQEQLRTSKADLDKTNKEAEQQEIKSGQLLEELKLMVDERKSGLEKARMKANIPNTLLAAKEFQKNQLNLQLAELELQRAEAALRLEQRLQEVEKEVLAGKQKKVANKVKLLEADIAKATVFAEGDGIFIVGRDRRGNRVKVGDQVWRGRTVAEIPDMESLQVLLQIPEREAARVKAGQRVRFRLEAKPEDNFEGRIESRGSVVRNRSRNQPAKVFDARVSIDQLEPELMRPGMRVTAEIFTSPGNDG